MDAVPLTRIFQSLLFLLIFHLSSQAYSQTMTITVTGGTSFQIQLRDVSNWQIIRLINGTSSVFDSGGAGSHLRSYTLPAGSHTFRLNNCYPYLNGCSSSGIQTINLLGTPPPAMPVITGTADMGTNSIKLTWNRPNTATRFKLSKTDGFAIELNDLHFSDSQVTLGKAYVYGLQACNALECSATATVTVAYQTTPVVPSVLTITYTYDALGRLTFVQDPLNGTRDYDYDKVGNRTEVAIGETVDDPPPLPVLPAPSLSAGACWSIGPGAWKATWSAVAGAGAYLYRTEVGSEHLVTSLDWVQTSPCKWVRACHTKDLATCNGIRAYF